MSPLRFRGVVAFFTVLLFSVCSMKAPVPKSIKTPTTPSDCPPELRLLKPGIKLTEVVKDPDIMTPTGIDVDALGRIWAVANHTHFRPDAYDGPKHDEILVFTDRDGDGRAEERRVFYNQTDATTDLELGPDGWLYLVERDRVLRVKDSDGDGVGDVEENIAVLKTEADYPHNGMAGIAWHPSGDLVFALGENYWREWTLAGTDGRTVTGTGEGGIFRCRPDGSKLRRIARGFWNPFGVCVRPDGEIFAAENDPGSRPPCRLIHVVEGGDYGYQRLYGNAPFHPFVCWNGELRGTLPMVSPTGEAPCGVAPLGGGVIVPSWADHRIDFFPLKRNGATYTAERIEIVAGGDFFRPTCIKQVSPTTYYLTDWVFGSYELHKKGRIWKLEIDPKLATGWLQPTQPEPMNDAARLAHELRNGRSTLTADALVKLASHRADPFLARAALQALAGKARFWNATMVNRFKGTARITAMLAVRMASPKNELLARTFLGDSDPDIRFEALRWIADERLIAFKSDIEKLLQSPDLDFQLFEACLAASNVLAGNPRAGVADVAMLLQRVKDKEAPTAIRAFALRLLPPAHGKLTHPLMNELLALNNPELSLEVVRTMAGKKTAASQKLLTEIAGDKSRTENLRAEAIVGLSSGADKHLELLLSLAEADEDPIRDEALRALRFLEIDDAGKERLQAVAKRRPDSRALVEAVVDSGSLTRGRPDPADAAGWQKRITSLAGRGNPEVGRRIFFHSKVALCATCHRHSGCGVVLGPDLSAVAARNDEQWLIHSIVKPSAEVSPQYFPWSIETKDGEEFVGIMLRKGGTSGREFYRNIKGSEQSFLKADIVGRRELKSSLMPEGLLTSLTDEEIRDLLAFLQTGTGGN